MKRQRGDRILDLTESNPTRAGLQLPAEEILTPLSSTSSLVYEPHPRGLDSARRAVSEYYAQSGYSVDPDRIHLTAGTSEAYSFLLKLLTEYGQSVLIPRPGYPLLDFISMLEGVELKPFDLQYHHPTGWCVDFDSIQNSIADDTGAIIMVSPNNPTGSFIKHEELNRLNNICQKHSLALIVDEVFHDYNFHEDESRAGSLVTNDKVLTFVLNGISKMLALPQMKLGWIVTNGPQDQVKEALERLDLISDTFLSVGTPVQHAMCEWMKYRSGIQSKIKDRLVKNLDLLSSYVESSPCRLLAVEGGWYATLEIPRRNSEEDWVLTMLEDYDVLAHPGYFFDFPNEAYLILSLLPETVIFEEAVRRIVTLVLDY